MRRIRIHLESSQSTRSCDYSCWFRLLAWHWQSGHSLATGSLPSRGGRLTPPSLLLQSSGLRLPRLPDILSGSDSVLQLLWHPRLHSACLHPQLAFFSRLSTIVPQHHSAVIWRVRLSWPLSRLSAALRNINFHLNFAVFWALLA